MQGNLLFVGCSHTSGYYADDNGPSLWSKNNYAQIYADDIADKQCYIYGSTGAPNSKYPRWIRHVLNNHENVSGVVIQTTYWDRWSMGNNRTSLFLELPVGHFSYQHTVTDNYICYDDFNTLDHKVLEWNDKALWSQIDYWKWGNPGDIKPGTLWPGYNEGYMQTKFHTEVDTHLTNENYCKDIALIDAMCDEKNIPIYIWQINERVQTAKNLDMFKKLNNVKIFETPATVWLKEELNTDIDTMKVDEEHYNYEAHKLIAHKFIPKVLKS
jgi:hypothetical protein